jgi:hypothetical protein
MSLLTDVASVPILVFMVARGPPSGWPQMHIAVVGGLDRHVASLEKQAAGAGHVAEFHHGRVGGRHAEDLESIVHRSNVVVIVIGVNSHGAVSIAKKAARRSGATVLIVRTCGPSRFEQILASLAREPLGQGYRALGEGASHVAI